MKLLEENIGTKFLDRGFSNKFLDMIPKAQAIKAKLNNKLKNFCTTKETINKMKIQPTEWEHYFQIIYFIRG